MRALRVLPFVIVIGCAPDRAATPTSEVGVTVLPVSSTTAPAPLGYASATPDVHGPPPATRDPVAAERYFTEARSLLSSGQVEQACALLQKSMDADPALGTMLNLGDCNEKLGNIPAACNAYRDVEAQARGQGQDARGELAPARAEKLGCR